MVLLWAKVGGLSTCQDVRLCLVVRVHPVGVDDPERVVVAHLVAVPQLVWRREDEETGGGRGRRRE